MSKCASVASGNAEQAVQTLRSQLLAAAASPPGAPADAAYFQQLRARVHAHKTGR